MPWTDLAWPGGVPRADIVAAELAWREEEARRRHELDAHIAAELRAAARPCGANIHAKIEASPPS
ncbi:MAG: hypothetical protein H7067_11775 [Burkholderiales bacterium]|nr:hypothetical protein [Opitutaceae bacterium]